MALVRRSTTITAIALWLLWMLTVVEMSASTALAAEAVDEIKVPVDTKPFVVVIKDEEGNPVQGATVRAAGLRVKESPGSYYGWPTANVGKAPEVLTDQQGRASFDYPPKFGQHPDWLHTITVCYYLEHPEFIQKHVETSPADSPWTESVVPGCELIVSAQTPGHEIITNLGVVIAGNQTMFAPGDGPGVIRSRAVPHGTRQVMLISPDKDDGKHLFSEVRRLPFAKSKKVTLRGLVLRPGLEVTGRLADKVPRPVKNGIVISNSIPMPRGKAHAEADASITWGDVAEVQPDGSFRFPSLPRTGKLQLIAICDGWMITSTAGKNFFTTGVIYELEDLEIEDGRWDGLEIAMEPTASVKVVVTDQDGNPIKGAEVGAWPNQKLEMLGSQILGDVYPSVNFLNRNWSREQHPLCKSDERYRGITDDQGTAVLRDLPLTNQSIAVSHDDYQVPKTEGMNDRYIKVLFEKPEQQTVTVTLERRPKP